MREGLYDPSGVCEFAGGPQEMASLPERDRPREKLLRKGSDALSDVELLAVIIGSGVRGHGVLAVASRLMRTLEGRPNRLTVETLTSVKGLGQAKACQIAASLEWARRHLTEDRMRIRQPTDVLPYLADIRRTKQEHFVCLSMSGAHEVIACRVVTVGLLDSSQVHPREVFADPITDRAAAVILAHNHPSNTLAASPEDRALTRRLVSAGDLLGIRVLDHVIVTQDAYLSMQQQGILT